VPIRPLAVTTVDRAGDRPEEQPSVSNSKPAEAMTVVGRSLEAAVGTSLL